MKSKGMLTIFGLLLLFLLVPVLSSGAFVEDSFVWGDEKVVFVVPDDFDFSVLSELNYTIRHKYPAIKDENFAFYRSSQVACNDYWRLEENTLILIGDRSNNNAIKCTVWFDTAKRSGETFDSSVTVERNVWGGNNYAVVISGNSTLGLGYLRDVVGHPERHRREFLNGVPAVNIYQFSMPPEYVSTTDYINGYVFNQCDDVGPEMQFS